MSNEFVGRTLALTRDGLDTTPDAISVGLPELWAVIAVETSGCGFFADRRPQILYERHLFHALTHGQFDDVDVSDPMLGGCGASEGRSGSGAESAHPRRTVVFTVSR